MHDLDVRSAVEGVDHHARLVRLGEGEAHDRSPLGRGDLGLNIVVGKVYRIVVGPCFLRLVREPALAGVLVDLILPAYGHDGELSVVVDPRRGLVGLLQTPDGVGPVGIDPSAAHLARLGRPEVHAPRQGHGRVGVARRKRVVGLRAHERRDILRRSCRRFVAGGCRGAPRAASAAAAQNGGK